MKDGFIFLAFATGISALFTAILIGASMGSFTDNKRWFFLPAGLFIVFLITGFMGVVL